MLRIGMIGSENSHSKAVSKVLNVDKLIKGVKVVAVWGETRAFAEETAAAGEIPTIVKKPEDMLGMVDGVMVDNRHGKYHLPATTPFIKAGIPAFVDKPFCCSVVEGKRFLKLAKSRRVAVTSYSSIPIQKAFLEFRDKVQALGKIYAGSSSGPCDLKSKYGGVFFYGVHQVESVIALFGMSQKILKFGVMILIGQGLGTSALVGQYLGSKHLHRAWLSAVINMQLGAAVMFAFAILVGVFAPQLVAAFFPEPELIAPGSLYLRLLAIGLPFLGLSIGSEQA